MQTCAHCCIAAFTACRVSAEFGSSVVPCAGGLPPLSSVGQFGADLGRGERSVMKTSQQCNNRRHKAAREAAAKTCHNKCSRSQIPESAHLIIGLQDASIKLEILNPGWQSNLAQVSAVVLLPLHCSLTFLASQLDPPRPMLPQMTNIQEVCFAWAFTSCRCLWEALRCARPRQALACWWATKAAACRKIRQGLLSAL